MGSVDDRLATQPVSFGAFLFPSIGQLISLSIWISHRVTKDHISFFLGPISGPSLIQMETF